MGQGFSGWRVVGVTTLAQLIAVGCTSYIFGLYVEPVSEEFGASRMSIGMGITVLYLVSALLSPALGYWLDRGSIRTVMTLGGVFMATGLAALGSARQLWQMTLAIMLLVAVGFSMMGPLPSSKVVTNWFIRKRGRALGVSALGTSLGGFLLPPVAAMLILEVGWRGSLWILGIAVALVILPAVRWVIVNRPEEVGQAPDGAPGMDPGPPAADGDAAAPAGDAPLALREVLRDRSFWGIGLSVALLSAAGTLFLVHFPAYATELRIEPTTAALILSCYAGGGMAGKLLYGALADRLDERLLFWSVALVKGGAFLLLLGTADVFLLLLVGIVFGLGAGGTLPLWNLLIGRCFGRQAFGRVMGLMGLILLPFLMLPAPLGGYVFDRTGSYVPAFQVGLTLFPLAALAIFLIRVPEREPGT